MQNPLTSKGRDLVKTITDLTFIIEHNDNDNDN